MSELTVTNKQLNDIETPINAALHRYILCEKWGSIRLSLTRSEKSISLELTIFRGVSSVPFWSTPIPLSFGETLDWSTKSWGYIQLPNGAWIGIGNGSYLDALGDKWLRASELYHYLPSWVLGFIG